MTLAVARIRNDVIALAADTQITDVGVRLPLSKGALKIFILPGEACIAYSNSAELAIRDIHKFVDLYPQGTTFGDTVRFFEASSRLTENEYILCFDLTKKIIKITCGMRVKSLSKTAWIGDYDAYVSFRKHENDRQSHYFRGRAVPATIFMDEINGSPACDLYATMRSVVHDQEVISVGGLISVVSSRGNGFRFSVYCDMFFDWPSSKNAEDNIVLEEPIALHSSEENLGYSVCQFSTAYSGVNAVAFYFSKANLFYLLWHEPQKPSSMCTAGYVTHSDKLMNVFNSVLGFYFQWWIFVSIAVPSLSFLYTPEAQSGMSLSIFVQTNTYPPSAPNQH